jgi:ABC-type branched-subunit amino acid transport system ATPase component
MRTVMSLCDTITVIDFGKKLAEGLPHEIQMNKAVIEAYLGAEDIVA